jgi:putative cell wall-binding protein
MPLCRATVQKYNCPILINEKEHLLPSVKREIERLGAKQAILIGGTGLFQQMWE